MKNITTYIIGIALLFSGCESWLDVKPYDQIAEKNLFSTPQGFRNVLNGVYIDLNKSPLYGKSLTVSWIDVLAQFYNIANEEHSMYNYRAYRYNEEGPKKAFQETWNTMYKQIGDLNLLLANIETEGSVLNTDERNLLKGEALGLRAMIHFDLLRLFGPIYVVDSTIVSLPYCDVFDGFITELLPANIFKDRVLRDLNAAERLLANDPVVENGPMMSMTDDGKVINRYRALRLNYYAVLALQARVALYVNMPNRALSYAERAMTESAKWFPFADGKDWVFKEVNPDLILSSECLFSLQNTKRNDLYRGMFQSTLSVNTLLTPLDIRISALYEATDWRLRAWWENVIDSENTTEEDKMLYYLLKYKGATDVTLIHNTMIPLFRRSELNYIAAEVLAMQDATLGKACEYLDEVRRARGIREPLESTLTSEDVQKEILEEYQREFCGEGQLFFYYKRQNTESIPSGYLAVEVVLMSAKEYVLPIPESELQHRN